MNNDRLISLNAAIDALNEYFSRIGKLKRRGLSNAEKAISLDTVGAIKSLPSAQQWIPVTEHLPEKSSPWRTGYLATVTSDTWSEPSVMYVEWETTTVRGKEVSRWIWNDKLFPKCWDLVAWMPLPEPYQEKE